MFASYNIFKVDNKNLKYHKHGGQKKLLEKFESWGKYANKFHKIVAFWENFKEIAQKLKRNFREDVINF